MFAKSHVTFKLFTNIIQNPDLRHEAIQAYKEWQGMIFCSIFIDIGLGSMTRTSKISNFLCI